MNDTLFILEKFGLKKSFESERKEKLEMIKQNYHNIIITKSSSFFFKKSVKNGTSLDWKKKMGLKRTHPNEKQNWDWWNQIITIIRYLYHNKKLEIKNANPKKFRIKIKREKMTKNFKWKEISNEKKKERKWEKNKFFNQKKILNK